MTILQQRQYDRFERSIKFIGQNKGDFASGSKALSLSDELQGVLDGFKSASQETKPAGKGSRSYKSAKLSALNALREDLVAISRSAQVLEGTDAKFKNTFLLPDRRRKNDLAAAARQFIKDATPLKSEFQGLEMKEDFLEQLQGRLDAYEAAQSGQGGTVKGEAPVATDALGTLVAQGSRIVDVLDVIMRNKFRGQSDVLKAWDDASMVEFTPRRKKGERAAEKAAKS